MEFSVKIDGLNELAAKSRRVARVADEEIAKALYVSGKQVEKEAKQSILDGNKTGRLYRRGTVVHRASAPGEAPANDTGRLVNSINTEADANSATVKAGGGIVTYAAHLEFGTRHIAPRPFLFPALERSKAFIRARFEQALAKTVDRSRQ